MACACAAGPRRHVPMRSWVPSARAGRAGWPGRCPPRLAAGTAALRCCQLSGTRVPPAGVRSRLLARDSQMLRAPGRSWPGTSALPFRHRPLRRSARWQGRPARGMPVSGQRRRRRGCSPPSCLAGGRRQGRKLDPLVPRRHQASRGPLRPLPGHPARGDPMTEHYRWETALDQRRRADPASTTRIAALRPATSATPATSAATWPRCASSAALPRPRWPGR